MFTTVAADTRRLADLFNGTHYGDLVSFKMMSDVVGYNILQNRTKMLSARKMALRETGVVFVSVRGKGISRIPRERIAADVGGSGRKRIRSTARTTNQALNYATAKINDFPDAERIKVLREQSVLGLLEYLARDRQLPPINNGETRPLTYAQTAKLVLDAFNNP